MHASGPATRSVLAYRFGFTRYLAGETQAPRQTKSVQVLRNTRCVGIQWRPNFPDEFRVHGQLRRADIALGLLSDHIARGPPQSIGYCVHPPRGARCLGGNACQNKNLRRRP